MVADEGIVRGAFVGWGARARESFESPPPECKCTSLLELNIFADSQKGGTIFYSRFMDSDWNICWQEGIDRTHKPGYPAHKMNGVWYYGPSIEDIYQAEEPLPSSYSSLFEGTNVIDGPGLAD